MQLVQLIIPAEAAHDTVSQLGEVRAWRCRTQRTAAALPTRWHGLRAGRGAYFPAREAGWAATASRPIAVAHLLAHPAGCPAPHNRRA